MGNINPTIRKHKLLKFFIIIFIILSLLCLAVLIFLNYFYQHIGLGRNINEIGLDTLPCPLIRLYHQSEFDKLDYSCSSDYDCVSVGIGDCGAIVADTEENDRLVDWITNIEADAVNRGCWELPACNFCLSEGKCIEGECTAVCIDNPE